MRYKLGINLDLGFDVSMEESLLAAKAAGFEAFFVTWKPDRSDTCRALASLAKTENMIFQSIHAPWDGFQKLWYPDGDTDRVVESTIECVRLCHELKVPLMIIHPFVGFDREYIATEEGVRNFAKIVAVAEELGVNLAFENLEGEPYLAAIMEQLGNSPRVGFCWDTGHEQCYNRGKKMPELYANGKLFGTHLNDNLGVTGEKLTWHDDAHLLPYDGIVDWHGVMERLQKAGFKEEILTFELTRNNKPDRHTHDKYANWDLQEFMNQAYARAKKVASELK